MCESSGCLGFAEPLRGHEPNVKPTRYHGPQTIYAADAPPYRSRPLVLLGQASASTPFLRTNSCLLRQSRPRRRFLISRPRARATPGPSRKAQAREIDGGHSAPPGAIRDWLWPLGPARYRARQEGRTSRSDIL